MNNRPLRGGVFRGRLAKKRQARDGEPAFIVLTVSHQTLKVDLQVGEVMLEVIPDQAASLTDMLYRLVQDGALHIDATRK